MDPRAAILAVCLAAALIAGCSSQPAAPAPAPAGTVTGPAAVSLQPQTSASLNRTMVAINVSPVRYSPIMSSTPGIGLEPVVTGFAKENASFSWTASYGHFLTWDARDYHITTEGDTARNHGEKIYWSFSDLPSTAGVPVKIFVTATDPGTGRLLGSATVTLDWVGNTSVAVRENR